jgi:hypothetical protein
LSGKVSFSTGNAAITVFTTRPDVKRPLVIPMYNAVPVFIIKNLLRTAGMSRERYFELMENV